MSKDRKCRRTPASHLWYRVCERYDAWPAESATGGRWQASVSECETGELAQASSIEVEGAAPPDSEIGVGVRHGVDHEET